MNLAKQRKPWRSTFPHDQMQMSIERETAVLFGSNVQSNFLRVFSLNKTNGFLEKRWRSSQIKLVLSEEFLINETFSDYSQSKKWQ